MATHTATHIAGTGGTYYAFPVSQSLGDWATYRIALAEASPPNLGRYQGTIDDANGSEWLVFSGASQPAGVYAAVATIDTQFATSSIAGAVIAAGDIDGYTLEQAQKLILAALAGKISGGGTTTNTIKAADGSKDRITATVDASGNRTSLTLDAS